MAERHHLDIQINLGGMTGRIQHLLQAAINFVSIGLNVRGSITVEALSLPDVTTQHVFNASKQWSLEHAGIAWEQWVLRNGFRDVAEAIGGVLEETQSVLSYWALIPAQKKQGSLTGEDWNEIVVNQGQKFHRRTLPQRIEFLQKTYGFALESDLVKQMLTINAARNCLVHRGGVVSHQDLAHGDELVVEWRALVLLMQQEGKDVEVEPPYFFKAATTLGVATTSRSKIFALGQPVSFNAREFSEICWTLFVVALSCASALEAFGKENGVEFASTATESGLCSDGPASRVPPG